MLLDRSFQEEALIAILDAKFLKPTRDQLSVDELRKIVGVVICSVNCRKLTFWQFMRLRYHTARTADAVRSGRRLWRTRIRTMADHRRILGIATP